MEILLIVEGKEDKEFLKFYTQKLKLGYKIEEVGGNKNFDLVREKIEEYNHHRVAIIFDCDDNFEESFNNIIKEKFNEVKIFLFPNNQDCGNLETILEKIVCHQNIIQCFNSFIECINRLGYEPPDSKRKLFSYKEILQCNPKEMKAEDFEKCFDIEHKFLEPLKDFLLGLKNE